MRSTPEALSVADSATETAVLYQLAEQAATLQTAVDTGATVSSTLLLMVTCNGLEVVWLPDRSTALDSMVTVESGIVAVSHCTWYGAVFVAPTSLPLT